MADVLRVTPRLQVATVANVPVRDISDLVQGTGRVVLNEDAGTAWNFQCEIRRDPSLELRPWLDYLAPSLEVVFDDGRRWSSQVGLYVVVPPASKSTRSQTTLTLDGRDLTTLVAADAFEDVFSVTPSDDPFEVLADILTGCGIPASRIRYVAKPVPAGQPEAAPVFHSARDWPPDTSKLTIVNDIHAMIGYLALGMDSVGRVGGVPDRDYATAEADATYRSGDGSTVTGEVAEDAPPLTSFANVVIVRPNQPALDAEGAPPDTGSPTPADGRTVRVTADIGLRLRESGSLSAPILLTMPKGTPATVTGTSVTADGYTWWPITAQVTGVGSRSGWSAGNWLETVTGDPDPVTEPEGVKASIEAIAVNDAPASPTSTVSLGRRIVRTHYDSKIETQAQADELAANLLQESLTRYRKLTLHTYPDPRRGLGEIYALDIRRDDGTVVAGGNWRTRGWELPFGPGVMTHTVYRIDPWTRGEATG